MADAKYKRMEQVTRPRRGAPIRRAGWVHDESEHDACAIIANVKKDGCASHGNVKRTLEALARMGHRTGEIEGEGDGAGLQTDIPREWWGGAARSGRFAPQTFRQRALHRRAHHDPARGARRRRAPSSAARSKCSTSIRWKFGRRAGARPLSSGSAHIARTNGRSFWQVAALPSARGIEDREIANMHLQLERELPVHIASLSRTAWSTKSAATLKTLRRISPNRPPGVQVGDHAATAATRPTPIRAPNARRCFDVGHNGEINSIDNSGAPPLAARFPTAPQASDSQVLDRIFEVSCSTI